MGPVGAYRTFNRVDPKSSRIDLPIRNNMHEQRIMKEYNRGLTSFNT